MINKDLLNYLGSKKRCIFIIVILNCIGLLLSVLTTGSFVLAIYYFVNYAANNSDSFVNGIYALLGALGFGLLRILAGYYSSKFSVALADYVTYKLRHETYEKYLELDGKTPFTTNEMAQLSTEGIEQLRLYYSNYLPSFFYAMIAPILLFIIIMFFDWTVALLYLCCVPLIPMSIVAVSKWAKKIFAKYWNQYTALGDGFLDNTKGMKELKIFSYDQKKQEQMDGSAEGFRKITMKVLTMQLASVTIMDLVAFGGAAVGIVLSLNSMRNGLHSLVAIPSDFALYIVMFMILIGAEFFLPMRALGSAFHIAMNGATAGKKIMTLFDIPVIEDGKKELTNIETIEFDHVNFKYEENPVLVDVSFKMDKGLYSLVGLSGSGKSTMAKLLSRTIRPISGEIKINGININEFTKKSFYKNIAYISNSSYIFHTDIRSIFKFYNPNITDERIKELLKEVKLDHLPLDYVIQEDYTNISGGEKQRLTLALYLSGEFNLYIFDEITSNIDIESEEIILEKIKELSKDKIVMMISHRLKSTEYSKEVNYLEDGKIILSDTFNNLLNKDNEFSRLYKLQDSMEVVL